MLRVDNLRVTYGHSGKNKEYSHGRDHDHAINGLQDGHAADAPYAHGCCGYIGPPAVDSVSFFLEKGERLGIVGESGSGKTTLGLAIMGLLGRSGGQRRNYFFDGHSATVEGKILFKNESLLTLSDSRLNTLRWRTIAMVFQNSLEVLNPVLTIGAQIKEPLQRHAGLTSGEADTKAQSLLESVGLNKKWLSAYPHELSGGMRQRVLIAMAISCDPELLIVDEPTTSLDPQSSREILDLLDAYLHRTGAAMIMISHNMTAIRKMTGRMMTLYSGCVVEEGETEAVFAAPLHGYTRGLLTASPDHFVYRDLWGIPGEPPQNRALQGCPFYPRCTQRMAKCETQRPHLEIVANVDKANCNGQKSDSDRGISRRVACHKGGIEIVLTARNIHKTYGLNGKAVPALKGVDLEIRSGEVVALVGHSGSGKSTLAQILVHAVTPDRGQVTFMGEPVKNGRCTSRMDGLQIVFQDAVSAINGRMRVKEVVLEPLKIMGWHDKMDPNGKKEPNQKKDSNGKKDSSQGELVDRANDFDTKSAKAYNSDSLESRRHRLALDALKQVHLPVTDDFLNRHSHHLSGGQRQRLAIARALITRPRLVVADEITAMLDPSTRANLLRELKGIQIRSGFSMLFITHDLFLARKVADRVYEMQEGVMTERSCSMFHEGPHLHAHDDAHDPSGRIHCHIDV